MEYRERGDWHYLDVQIWKRQEMLEKLLKHSTERSENLGDFSNRYEEETDPDPTPEEEARLARIMAVWNRSHAQTDRLWLRLAAVKKMAVAHEEDLMLKAQARRRLRTRALERARQVTT